MTIMRPIMPALMGALLASVACSSSGDTETTEGPVADPSATALGTLAANMTSMPSSQAVATASQAPVDSSQSPADSTQPPPPPSGMGSVAGPGASSAPMASVAPMTSVAPMESSALPAGETCPFELTSSTSEKIGAVGIVEWSITGRTVMSANIQFGLDTTYGMTAPVDLSEAGYRTLLLGMKGDKTYHFKVVAATDMGECTSADYTIKTEPAPNAIELPDIETADESKLANGFSITSRWGTNAMGPSYILDRDNDVVWWYPAPDDVFRTVPSYDGKYMWMRNTAQSGGGLVRRVTLDGLKEEEWELPDSTHDLAVLPDGKIGLISWVDTEPGERCDEIIELDPATGETKHIFSVSDAHGNTACHCNYLAYYAPDDSYFISDWAADSYIKIKRSGEIVWVINGDGATITGANWQKQHGIHILGDDHILVFSNEGRTGDSSLVIEYTIDAQAKTATENWIYDGMVHTGFGGDAQRLSNGNTIISYSSSGVIQQVDKDGELLQSMVFPVGNSVGYLVHVDSLYDAPPPKIWGLAGPPSP